MTKEQHIDFWMNTAEEDWTTVGVLYAMDRYLHSLFWAHLTLEKLTKAIWIKHNASEIPPNVDNIVCFLEEANVDLGNDKMAFIAEFNRFQICTTNPDNTNKLYQACTRSFTMQELEKVKEVRTCLLNMLP